METINDLYRHELRWRLNLFRPSAKLLRKKRVGSKLRRVYGPAQTPLERVAECEASDPERVAALKKLQSQIDPFELAPTIDRKLQRLYRLAHQRLSARLSLKCRQARLRLLDRLDAESDTPREAGGLVSGTASKAVAQVVPSSR